MANGKDSSSEPRTAARPGQIEVLCALVREFEDWLAEREKDASLRGELEVRLEMTGAVRDLAATTVIFDEDDPRAREFFQQFAAAIACGEKALQSLG